MGPGCEVKSRRCNWDHCSNNCPSFFPQNIEGKINSNYSGYIPSEPEQPEQEGYEMYMSSTIPQGVGEWDELLHLPTT